MAQQDAACAALVVMTSVAEESSSTSLLLSTEIQNGRVPISVDRVSNSSIDVGPTDVTDASILAGLGLIEVYGLSSRDVNPVGDRGDLGANIGEPSDPNFELFGGSDRAESLSVGGFSGRELAANGASLSLVPKSQRFSAAGGLGMSSQPCEYSAWSGVAGGSFGNHGGGEYSENFGVS